VALLLYLAVAKPNGVRRRDKLLGLFWPERDQEHGRGALRKAVCLLRQSLGEEAIVSRATRGSGWPKVLCGAMRWRSRRPWRQVKRRGRSTSSGATCWGGFYIPEAPEFERWVDGERGRLRGLACRRM
jgi:DNA-binding SARP family transcriptional activator